MTRRIKQAQVLLAVLFLVACALPTTPTPGETPDVIPEECWDLPAAWSNNPDSVFFIVLPGQPPTTQIGFSWMYPGGCYPDRFRVVMNDIPLRQDPLFDEYYDAPGDAPTVVYEDGTTATAYSFSTTETYNDGIYWWWVTPYYGDLRGETSPAYTVRIITYHDGVSYCPEELWQRQVDLELIYPFRGSTVHTLNPTLIWRDRNPQLIGCNNPLMSWYQILWSHDSEALSSLTMDELMGMQSWCSYNSSIDLWDCGEYLPEVITLPIEIRATAAYDARSTFIMLGHDNCHRIYWKVLNYWKEYGDIFPAIAGGAFHDSAMSFFDVDPALCEPTDTPEAAAPPMAVPLDIVNCRSGPTLDYPVWSILPEGGRYEIRGRNSLGNAWQVYDPEIDETCWVNADLVEVIGDTNLVQITIPPLPPLIGPTDTAPSSSVDCSIYNTNIMGCNNNPACYWDPTDPPASNGSCKNK